MKSYKHVAFTTADSAPAIPEDITYEYVVCPYCESFDFEEYKNGIPTRPVTKVPDVQYPKQVTQFDPADLMQHIWKGKKIAQGQWEAGSLAFGWDFKNTFADTTIAALPVTIDKYDFSLNGNFVNSKKVKQ